mmetsp:Transcript_27717/g.73152  ORF Transcript_27717/g.73152 Transcript_27717/m.73152 type:complete len:203 (-) Transcript_27717:817-1425(-)
MATQSPFENKKKGSSDEDAPKICKPSPSLTACAPPAFLAPSAAECKAPSSSNARHRPAAPQACPRSSPGFPTGQESKSSSPKHMSNASVGDVTRPCWVATWDTRWCSVLIFCRHSLRVSNACLMAKVMISSSVGGSLSSGKASRHCNDGTTGFGCLSLHLKTKLSPQPKYLSAMCQGEEAKPPNTWPSWSCTTSSDGPSHSM